MPTELGRSECSATVMKGLQLQAANVSGELQQPRPRYQAWGDDMMWRGSVINWARERWADLYATSARCQHCANNVFLINWLCCRSIVTGVISRNQFASDIAAVTHQRSAYVEPVGNILYSVGVAMANSTLASDPFFLWEFWCVEMVYLH